MSTYLTTGFVLRQQPWREHDRLYTMLTASHGRVDVIAAGTRKGVSKLSPHLQPFAEIEVMIARGKQIDRLAAARLTTSYLKPPYELPQVLVGAALLEVARTFANEGTREPELSNLLRQHLQELSTVVGNPDWRPFSRALLARYLVGVLKLTGLAVPLTTCDVCRAKLNEAVVFSWQRHGFMHQTHAQSGEAMVQVPQKVVDWFGKVAAPAQEAEQLPTGTLAFLTDYAQAQAQRELSTLHVLRSTIGT